MGPCNKLPYDSLRTLLFPNACVLCAFVLLFMCCSIILQFVRYFNTFTILSCCIEDIRTCLTYMSNHYSQFTTFFSRFVSQQIMLLKYAQRSPHFNSLVKSMTYFISAALPRSTSTPGLIESAGKIPLEDMWVSPMPLHSPDHNSTSPASM